jgi:integrase
MHELSPIRRPGDGRLPLSRVAAGYLADHLPRVTASSHERERRFLDTWLVLLGDIDVHDIDRATVVRCRSARVRAGAAVTSINAEVGGLRRALAWAVDNGYMESNPLADLKKLPVRERDLRKRRRALTEDEIQRLVATARKDDEEKLASGARAVPQLPLLLGLLYSGARRGELVATRWRHWEFNVPSEFVEGAAEVRLTKTKNAKERIVPVPEVAAREILALLPYHEKVYGRKPTEHDLVFLSARGKPYHGAKNPDRTTRLLRRWLEQAGIPRDLDGLTIDTHALRTTYATRMAEAGVELGERQALLGHSDPRVTERHYVRRSARHHHRALARLLEIVRENGISEVDLAPLLSVLEQGSPMGPGEPHELEGGESGPHSPTQPEDPAGGTLADSLKNPQRVLAALAELFIREGGAERSAHPQPDNQRPPDTDTIVIGGDSSRDPDYGTRRNTHKPPPEGNPIPGYRAPLVVHTDALPPGDTLTIVVVGRELPQGDPNHDSENHPRG